MNQQCQRLESRRLLSSVLVGGVLTVTGDDNANTIDVSIQQVLSVDRVVVTIDSVTEDFDPTAVVDVVVNAAHGDDLITLGAVGQTRLANGEGDRDTLIGGPLDDSLDGGGADDRISGGAGNDNLRGFFGNDRILGGGGDDNIFGGGGAADTLDGGSGNDRITGGQGGDTIFGQGGDENILASEPQRTSGNNDVLSGGSGRDILSYAAATQAVFLSPGNGQGDDGFDGEGDNAGPDFEIFEGSMFDDVIDLTGMAGRRTVLGWLGNDTITGGSGADVLAGDAGDDSIDGALGEDRVFAGPGDDMLIGNDGIRDVLIGNAGNDTADADVGLDNVLDVETTN